MTIRTIIADKMQIYPKELLVIICSVLTALLIVEIENVYAQAITEDKIEKYPLAFNQTGNLKAYDDCGYEPVYLTPQLLPSGAKYSLSSELVDNIIIEYSINESSDNPSNTDLTSYGGLDLGLFENNIPQERELDLRNITQAQVDCLTEIREVEKSREYKDCGYVGSNTSQAVDQRLSDLSMKIIPITENTTQKAALQQEADCLVDIRSMEKQDARNNELGGKYQNYEIIDGKVVEKTQPPYNVQDGLNAMITDLKNDGEALKAEIANTNLFNTGLVQNLINKVYYYQGQISVMGGGTWSYLHDVQDTLIAKIKGTGQDGFTIAEQAAIDSFATDAAQSKIEHPSTNIFG
jgi:hypothetical protein